MKVHIDPFDGKAESATAFAELGWNEPTSQNDPVLYLKKELK